MSLLINDMSSFNKYLLEECTMLRASIIAPFPGSVSVSAAFAKTYRVTAE
jgi:hypothetical protein